MNTTPGPTSWISVLFLISALLFQGVASAAMLCCSPADSGQMDHGSMKSHQHQMHKESSTADLQQHHAAEHAGAEQHDTAPCPGCAAGCTAAAMIVNSIGQLSDTLQPERIVNQAELTIALTSSGLERPPRLIS